MLLSTLSMWPSAEVTIMPLLLETAPHCVRTPAHTSLWHDGAKSWLDGLCCLWEGNPFSVQPIEKCCGVRGHQFPRRVPSGISWDSLTAQPWAVQAFRRTVHIRTWWSSMESCCSSSLNWDVCDEGPSPMATPNIRQSSSCWPTVVPSCIGSGSWTVV